MFACTCSVVFWPHPCNVQAAGAAAKACELAGMEPEPVTNPAAARIHPALEGPQTVLVTSLLPGSHAPRGALASGGL